MKVLIEMYTPPHVPGGKPRRDLMSSYEGFSALGFKLRL
jgi:hypothetical protein